MRFAVIILLVLGMLAAGSGVLLFGWVQARRTQPGAREGLTVEVLLAQDNLPARTLLANEHVALERVPRTALPHGYFTNSAQAIGKTLKMAVLKGQPLSEACCIAKGSVDDLLRPGMLAFPVPLSQRSSAVGLLYPGCVVDVFATFPLRNRDKGEAVVTPLLQNIQVLGVANDTVVSSTQDPTKLAEKITERRKSASSSGNTTVTLEVNSRQAAALQLAMEQGTLGLAMRNPLDKDLNSMEPMVVKEGQLTAASESMDPQTLALFSKIQRMLGNSMAPVDANNTSFAGPRPTSAAPDPNANVTSALEMPSIPEYIGVMKPKRTAWQMTIIRGQKVEEAEIPLKQAEEEQAIMEETGNSQ